MEQAGIDGCCAVSHSQGHGHYESRSCYICEDIEWLAGREKWSGLAGIGVIFCKVGQAGKVSRIIRSAFCS